MGLVERVEQEEAVDKAEGQGLVVIKREVELAELVETGALVGREEMVLWVLVWPFLKQEEFQSLP